MLNYHNIIAAIIAKQIPELELTAIRDLIEVPPQPELGDYALPCFKLAKIKRQSPVQIAAELVTNIGEDPHFSTINAQGPYVNFYSNPTLLAQDVLSTISDLGLGYGSHAANGKTITIDYSSPNIAKPFHVGHLRTTIIGQVLYNIYSHLGYQCVGINHLGDWGTQFGKQILAYLLWGDDEVINANPVSELVKLYVRFHTEAESNPDLDAQARDWFRRLEEGDSEALRIWRWISEVSLKDFSRLYKRLNIKFDHFTGESFYLDQIPAVVEELKAKNLLLESDDALVVDLGEDMPPCLIVKADGTTIYTSRDIATALYRKKTYDFSKSLYVVDYSQSLHFKQCFKVIELMGYDWARDLIHIPFGRVRLLSGKMSSRKGNVILLEDMLEEALARTTQIIAERNPNLADKEVIADQIAIGALIFNDLYNNRINDVVFDWDIVLNFDGETGPYVQYTYARSCRVLEKAPVAIESNVDFTLLNEPETIALIKSLYDFPDAVERAADEYEPSVLARQTMQVARNFNRFYHNHQIISDDAEVQKARLLLCKASNTVLKLGLNLLNMPAPERM